MRDCWGPLWSVHACGRWGCVPKFGCIIDDRIINSTLHRAKEMVVKMWDMNGMVDH